MEILFLGTGAGIPSRTRNVSSLILRLHDEINEAWMFDCGEATQHQILETVIRPRKISTLFITHLHGDHIFGIPGFLSSRSFQGGDSEITIYGPQGIREYILTSLRISKTNLTYPLNIIELDPKGGWITHTSGWKIQYLPLRHGILSYGFRIFEPDKKGELLMNLLAPYNVPNGPILGQLKRGETVTLQDGTVLSGTDFIAPDRPGRIISILGDTRPCRQSTELARNATVLVHEGTHGGDEAEMANRYGHSTNIQAAQLARDNQVQMLLINHVSARYLHQDVNNLLKQARNIMPNTFIVEDFQNYKVPENITE